MTFDGVLKFQIGKREKSGFCRKCGDFNQKIRDPQPLQTGWKNRENLAEIGSDD